MRNWGKGQSDLPDMCHSNPQEGHGSSCKIPGSAGPGTAHCLFVSKGSFIISQY